MHGKAFLPRRDQPPCLGPDSSLFTQMLRIFTFDFVTYVSSWRKPSPFLILLHPLMDVYTTVKAHELLSGN